MKPKDIAEALLQGDPHRVLIRNGGWHGHPHQQLTMKPAFDGEDDPWVIGIHQVETGVLVHEMWVESENVLAVCVPPVAASYQERVA